MPMSSMRRPCSFVDHCKSFSSSPEPSDSAFPPRSCLSEPVRGRERNDPNTHKRLPTSNGLDNNHTSFPPRPQQRILGDDTYTFSSRSPSPRPMPETPIASTIHHPSPSPRTHDHKTHSLFSQTWTHPLPQKKKKKAEKTAKHQTPAPQKNPTSLPSQSQTLTIPSTKPNTRRQRVTSRLSRSERGDKIVPGRAGANAMPCPSPPTTLETRASVREQEAKRYGGCFGQRL